MKHNATCLNICILLVSALLMEGLRKRCEYVDNCRNKESKSNWRRWKWEEYKDIITGTCICACSFC